MPRDRSTTTGHPSAPLRLRALIGPYIDVYTIEPGGQAAIGRAAASEVCLVHEAVSRRHATVLAKAGSWFLVDDASAGATFLNGIRLDAAKPALLNHGDLIRIGPWTFRVEIGHETRTASAPGSVMHTLDDAAAKVERLATRAPNLAVERLQLLTDCLSQLHAAREERELAVIALTHALKGTGYPRGAVLLPTETPGEVSIVYSQGFDVPGVVPTFSRSLLAEAATGHAAALADSASVVSTSSIAEMQIRSALCAPVLLSDSVCAFLYLDAPRDQRSLPADAGPFCEAVARAYGLALASLKRAELERRQSELTAELQSARAVQQTIAPPASGRVLHINYAVHVQPGVFVAGDLFDVIPIDGGVAILLGDVSGHGVGSGMLMAVTQAHLNAHLRTSGDVAAAIHSLNAYLCAHSSEGRFVSLWLGVVAPSGEVRFIDAGHGHWHIHRSMPGSPPIDSRGGIPLGIDPDATYIEGRCRLLVGDRLVLYSDGVVEQRNLAGEMFGLDRVLAPLIADDDPDAFVRRIFTELQGFAARGQFDDDATIASVEILHD